MKNVILLSPVYACWVLLLSFPILLSAQMNINGVTRYGNEWINYDQQYYKMLIADDGIYRVSFQTLEAQGISMNDLSTLQVFNNGNQIPLYIGENYIEFFGRKNRSEIDQYLYLNGREDMLNPAYSLITDTSAYFLTVAAPGTPALRFQAFENDLNNLPPREEWFWGEITNVYTNGLVQPSSGELSQSTFDPGEGYALSIALKGSFDAKLLPKHKVTNSINNQLNIRLVGIGTNSHSILIRSNGQLLKTEQFVGDKIRDDRLELAPADSFQLKIQDTTGRIAIATVQLRYPRAFNFENQTAFLFKIAASDTPKFLEIENFNRSSTPPILYDITNQLRIVAAIEGNKIKINLPPSAQERELILINAQAGARTINALVPIKFEDYKAINADYVIITSKRLYNDGAGVQAYADYRASSEGGQYSTAVLFIEDLYEQFSYGIHRHPLAIRNFGYFALHFWNLKPRYLLLMGKGQEYIFLRNSAGLQQRINVSHVPTFGYPGSDNLLMARVDNQTPAIPVGRIAAINSKEVELYLEKVRQFENPSSNEDDARAWRKQVLHLGGGGSLSEQTSIRNSLNQLKTMMEVNQFGAEVTSFFKTSVDPIQQSQTEALLQRINQGVSIVTFFGHSSPTGFDLTLEDPASYENKERYMCIFSLGCQTGNYFYFNSSNQLEKSASEQFLMQENRGAIAFLGSTDRGNITPLYNFQREFYNRLGTSMYGSSLGAISKAVIQQFDTPTFSSIAYRSLLQQFSLHGDPALVLMPYGQPDYLIEKGSVAFAPAVISAQQDSFTLQFNILNIGKAIQDSLLIEITRKFPDGATYVAAEIKIPTPRYQQELAIRLPVLSTRGVGFNKIFIRLNSDNHIDELPIPEARTNNELVDSIAGRGTDFYIFSNAVTTLYPTPFAMVHDTPLRLMASTTNTTAPQQRYIIEIDTTAKFDSPFKTEATIDQIGGLIEWQPNITLRDSTVYYWRVSPDSTTQFGYIWSSSSFIYIRNGLNGWNQSHLYQFKQNQLVNMQLPEATRRWKFTDNLKVVKVGNTTYTGGYLPFAEFDGATYIYQGYYNAIAGGLYIFVVDGATGKVWDNAPLGQYGSQIEWGTTAFPFSTLTRQKRAAAIEFLQNIIPSGHYVVIFSFQNNANTYKPEEWEGDTDSLGTNLFDVLGMQGAKLIRSTATSGARPYIFVYKKDDPLFKPQEVLADSAKQILEKEFLLYGNWFAGTIHSKIIGNASAWSRLQWKVIPNDEYDKYDLDVYGIRSDSSAVLLMENLTNSDTSLAAINAQEFPMLRLQLDATDQEKRTAPQLDYWRVLYEGLPDAVLAPNLYFQLNQDTLPQGAPLKLEVAVANASNYDMDSLLVKYNILKDGVLIRQEYQQIQPLLQQDTLIVNWTLDTRTLSGAYRILIEVNPDKHQKELYFFNNIGVFDVFIEKDNRNPLLDVTFDGIRIMDGDLVSAKPHITIQLKDENRYLRLDNPSLFNLFLESPTPDNPLTPLTTQIDLSKDGIQFYPASADGKANQAKLEWQPSFANSGRYALIVQAKDASGNAAAQIDYRINFEIITESLISNVFNYPNPFSTSTRFVYTLTGDEIPTQFIIQIMTVSGRIVRELTQNELGPLRIGTHQTEFAWDGTDTYGNRLANGVYLYRMIIKDQNGKELGKYENDTDRFFKNSIGKLVILR